MMGGSQRRKADSISLGVLEELVTEINQVGKGEVGAEPPPTADSLSIF